MMFMRACLIVAAFNKGSCNICHGRGRLTRRLTTAFVSRRLYTNTHDACLQQSTSTSVYDEEEIISTNRQYNINPSVQDRIQNLISHQAVRWDESSSFSSMHRKKSRQRHEHLFDNSDDRLFDQFAKAICMAGVVAQKEVFETWAAAVYIHSSFLSNEGNNTIRPKRRVVDVAGGHGLLSWALLLLDDEYQHKQSDDASQELTVFCLDVKMPKSAELISEAMLKQWPHLEDRFDYVEGRLEQLIPHPSCLLASVHACGILSDILVSTAAKHTIPLAVVPCCHSRKRIVLQHASSYAKDIYDDIINTKGSIPDLADRLDEARMVALDKAGLDVKEVFLPSLFTGKGRLIMGFPKSDGQAQFEPNISSHDEQMPNQTLRRKGQMPPLESSSTSIISKPVFMRGFTIPCKDDEESRELVSKLAGREAADTRKELMHNRHHEKSPTMDISVWLPNEDVGLSGDALSQIVESKHSVKCSAQKQDQYVNPAGRKSVTFRVQYSGFDTTILSFDKAKVMHDELYEMIPEVFPGVECR